MLMVEVPPMSKLVPIDLGREAEEDLPLNEPPLKLLGVIFLWLMAVFNQQ